MTKLLLQLALPVVLTTLFTVYMVINSQQGINRLTEKVRVNAPGNFLQLKHGKVHYRLEGPEEGELIVFIHGGGITGSEVWNQNLLYFLKNGYRILTFDLYGRGFTDRPRVDHSPELFQEQLTQLLNELQLTEPFHLVALSMGAIIALDYQHNYPDQVKKLVLIDPQATGNFRSNFLLTIPVVKDFLMTVYWYPRAISNQEKEFVNRELFKIYAQRLEYFMSFKGYKHTNYSTWKYMLNQNKLDLVSKVDLPDLLVIYGDQDPYFREGQHDLYLARFPAIQMKKIIDAGHMPQFEKPKEVNHLIHQFLTGNAEISHIASKAE